MVSHQLDVLRVPGSIPGETNFFCFLFLPSFLSRLFSAPAKAGANVIVKGGGIKSYGSRVGKCETSLVQKMWFFCCLGLRTRIMPLPGSEASLLAERNSPRNNQRGKERKGERNGKTKALVMVPYLSSLLPSRFIATVLSFVGFSSLFFNGIKYLGGRKAVVIVGRLEATRKSGQARIVVLM